MVLVFHGPMTADGAREGFRGQHNGGRIEGGFFPPLPHPSGGGTDQRRARHAHDCSDECPPLASIQGGAGDIDLDTPVLLAISRQIAAGGRGDGSRLRGGVLAMLQQSWLIAFDLNDQLIAGLASDLEGFFGSAWRRA